MPEPKKILFLLPYPLGRAPSQRFRVEAFFPLLKEHGYEFHTHSFFNEAAWRVLYKKGLLLKKGWAVIKGFATRYAIILCKVWQYDYIFIHREAAPLGPPIIEWLLSKVFRKRFIFDFDDAIWIPNTTNENRLVRWFKAFWKIKFIIRWAYKIAGGNDYLCNYAKEYNARVIKIPTCVDTERRHNTLKTTHNGKLSIGWTGSHSTLHYLEEIIPVIAKLQSEFDFTFLVISNKAPQLNLKDWQFIPWQEKTEIVDLLKMDIGVMPLKNDAWSEGKCGFKLIQYLSLGIPAVASPVGVNTSIIQNDISGFLASTQEQWFQALKQLVLDEKLRRGMGETGRKKIITEFSLSSQEQKFINLFT